MTEEAQTLEKEETMVGTIQVDVYAYREGDDVLFSHAWRQLGDPNRSKGKIEIPHGVGDVPIHFHLHDRTGLNLQFIADPVEAMWVDTNDCPTRAGNGNGQIAFDGSTPNLLRVTDDNSAACTLHYALRFDGDPLGAQPPYEYDPEIRNSGGG